MVGPRTGASAGNTEEREMRTVHASINGRVGTITLSRAHVLNCFNEECLRDFYSLLDWLQGHDSLRVMVVRGLGRAFCSGIDLTALAEGAISSAFFHDWEVALRRLETMDATVLAAIHSHCVGGGLQLALACDLRVARSDARLGVTAVKEGIIPGMGMWRIARHVGLGRAKQLSLTAEVIDAETALSWGLVNYVVEAQSFESRIEQLIEQLLAMAWTSTRLTKKLTNVVFDTAFESFLARFCEYQRLATASPEHQEAMAERRAQRLHRQKELPIMEESDD